MVSSRAITVEQYLAELAPRDREVISAVRDVINHHLPPGFVETMNWGMICWEIPLSRHPNTYNGHPLAYIAVCAQKNNYALYGMITPAITSRLVEEFRKAGVRLDMGKSCIRFRSLQGLPLAAVEALAASATIEQCIEYYERGRHGRTKPAAKPAKRKTARVGAPAGRPAKPAAAKKSATARKVAKKPARARAKPVARKPAKRAKRK